MLYIANAQLVTDGQRPVPSGVLVDGNRIALIAPPTQPPPGVPVLDATGLYLAPGFIDLQLNGGFGDDFTADPAGLWRVAACLPQFGVTAFLPTIVSSPLSTVAAAQAAWRQGPPPNQRGAVPLGLHVEGPFINPEKRGAHNPDHLRLPDVAAVTRWTPEAGVRLVTLAPELPRALDMIRALRAQGVVVSAGHSLATVEEAEAGFRAGIRYGTHLFNAMPPLDHRAPGLAGALLASPGITVGVIADGVHLHPAAVALAWRAKRLTGLTLVTDAMAALGMPPGRYRLGDYEATVDDTSVRLPDGRLAGSRLSLDAALRNLVEFTDCSLSEALQTVTAAPAAVLGLDDERGRVAVGYLADLVLLTADVRVAATIVAGEVAYRAAD